jgi:hypothetical protein
VRTITNGTTYSIGGLIWTFYNGTTPEWIGLVPEIILASDLRPVREQMAERYAHGGGWKPFNKFKIGVGMDNRVVLQYPGDPPLVMWCECQHPNGETVRLFDSAWLMVTQKDGSYEISRID